MPVTAQQMILAARSFLGYSEKNLKVNDILGTYYQKKPLGKRYEPFKWSDVFVSACAIKAGAEMFVGLTVGANSHIILFKEKQIFLDGNSHKPKAGYLIAYKIDGTKHIGVVEKVTGDKIIAICAGNTSVQRKLFYIGDSRIIGYARPNYLYRAERKTIDEVAKEVILGKWGNGKMLKENLLKAGYDYDLVQKRANELL